MRLLSEAVLSSRCIRSLPKPIQKCGLSSVVTASPWTLMWCSPLPNADHSHTRWWAARAIATWRSSTSRRRLPGGRAKRPSRCDTHSPRVCGSTRRRLSAECCALCALPKDVLASVLWYCEAEVVAAMRSSCHWFRASCEEWAKEVAQGRGWRMADGMCSWVERLAVSVCVFDPLSLRAMATRRRGSLATPLHKGQALFSEHCSAVEISKSGRYAIAGLAEPALLVSKRQRSWTHETCAKRRKVELCFEARVLEAGSSQRSSIYVGVAERSWTLESVPGRAVRSDRAWLLDLRRGRYVHEYPRYDGRVASFHGADRARLFATTDDVVRNGDVLGVCVRGDCVEFYKNGARLAFAAGGEAHPVPLPDAGVPDALRPPRDRVGWGRPIPTDADLVPIVEVHARLDDATPSSLKLELCAWDPRGSERFHRSRVLHAAGRRAPHRSKAPCLWLLMRGAIYLPALTAVAQLGLNLFGLAGGLPRSSAGIRAFADSFALSIAVSAIWKCHFYDRRRPRRSRRGLRSLLKVHFFKCLLVAALSSALTPRHPDLPVMHAAASFALWLICELASELAFHAAAQGSSFAADLRNFPIASGRRSHAGLNHDNHHVAHHNLLRFFMLFCFVPGAASILIALAASHFSLPPCVHISTKPYPMAPFRRSRPGRPAALFLETSHTSPHHKGLVSEIAVSHLNSKPRGLIKIVDDLLRTRTVQVRVFDDSVSRKTLANEIRLVRAGGILDIILACQAPCFDLLDVPSRDANFRVTPLSFDESASRLLSQPTRLNVAVVESHRDVSIECQRLPTDYRLSPSKFALWTCFYFVIGTWILVALFVKITLLMFGIATLCGFEDYDVPGWLLDGLY